MHLPPPFRSALLVLLPVLVGGAAAAQDDPFEEIAVQAPKAETPPPDVDRWIGELRSSDPVAREAAATALVEAGDAGLSAVRRLLAEAPPVAVELAARRVFGAIAGLSPEDADRVEERLREHAESGVADPSALAREILEIGDEAARHALRTARSLGPSPALDAVSRRLQALRAVRDLAQGHNRRDRAVRALHALGEPIVEELASIAASDDLESTWRLVASERLLHAGGLRALDPVLRIVDPSEPEITALLLPWIASVAPAARFADIAAALSPVLERDSALEMILAPLVERVPLETLRASLARAGSDGQRSLAALGLGLRRDRDARDGLKTALGSSPRVAESALVALGRIGDAADLDSVAGALRRDETAVRRAALSALATIGGNRAIGWASAALADGDASVRARAAHCLGHLGDVAAIDALVASLGDRDPSVLAAAAASLARITGEGLATALSVSSERERDETRTAWSSWLETRRKDAAKATPSGTESRPAGAAVAALAPEGARVLRELAGVLKASFRPYGDLKEKKSTDPSALAAAARAAMRELVDRTADPDDPDRLPMELAREGKAILELALDRGAFDAPDQLAQRVGSLPIGLSERDYALLVYEAARAMVSSLGDRFTRMSMIENAAGEVMPKQLPSLFGQQETTGLMLKKTDSGALVEFVFALGPAHRAGLRRGDKVVSLNGELALSMDESKLHRTAGKSVDLTVLRDGWTRPVAFHLEPERMDPKATVRAAMLPGGVGYLRLQQFELGCAQDLEWALRDLEKNGLKGLVLDLRNNPGGTVVDAIAIVDKFVPKGKTITTTWTNASGDAKDHDEQKYESTDSEADRAYPVAVLVNECSASASEMTSGALQDLERATIVGRTTWGKGIGQSQAGVRGLPRSSLFGKTAATLSLGVTVLEYFLPTGRSIQGIGVQPDVPVQEPLLLGDRFELLVRARDAERTGLFVDALVAAGSEEALALARFDAWDASLYSGLDALRADLRLEIPMPQLRRAVRERLRSVLAASHPELAIVDPQEDDDVRAAVEALAPGMGLDLATIPEWEDLAR